MRAWLCEGKEQEEELIFASQLDTYLGRVLEASRGAGKAPEVFFSGLTRRVTPGSSWRMCSEGHSLRNFEAEYPHVLLSCSILFFLTPLSNDHEMFILTGFQFVLSWQKHKWLDTSQAKGYQRLMLKTIWRWGKQAGDVNYKRHFIFTKITKAIFGKYKADKRRVELSCHLKYCGSYIFS